MNKIKVKICGITNKKDAHDALSAGADAIGFVFAKSPRQVSAAEVKAIVGSLGPWVFTVGVFVNESPAQIKKIAQACGLSAVQLHGSENPKSMRQFNFSRVIKAFRVDENFKSKDARQYKADAYLFDTKVAGAYGGTGRSFDWKLFKKNMGMAFDRIPVIISGGLGVNNVEEAVSVLRPYGVDVSSGVEQKPGKKSFALMKEFVARAKGIK